MPCSCSRLAAYASPSRTSPSHSTHRRHTCRVGRWARRMCCGPAAGGSAGCVRRRRQRVRRSVSPRPTQSRCCSGIAAPPRGPLPRRHLCSSRPAARACAPCATRASRCRSPQQQTHSQQGSPPPPRPPPPPSGWAILWVRCRSGAARLLRWSCRSLAPPRLMRRAATTAAVRAAVRAARRRLATAAAALGQAGAALRPRHSRAARARRCYVAP